MRRYMTINVHGVHPEWFNLGMIRVWGAQTAETLLKLVELRLNDFGLTLDTDVIAIVTDGASVMCKAGRIAPCEHVICLAHTIHLVVGDVFYKKKRVEGELQDVDDECELNANEASDEEIEPEADNDGRLPDSFSEISNDELPQLSDTIDPVIKKVRKVVGKFRKSPVKNDLLQQVVKTKYGKELRLLKDCKTRWSSLCVMLERFVRVSEAVEQVGANFI